EVGQRASYAQALRLGEGLQPAPGLQETSVRCSAGRRLAGEALGGGDHLDAAVLRDAQRAVALQVDADLAGPGQADECVSLDVGETELDAAVGECGLAGAAGHELLAGAAWAGQPLEQDAQCRRDGKALTVAG